MIRYVLFRPEEVNGHLFTRAYKSEARDEPVRQLKGQYGVLVDPGLYLNRDDLQEFVDKLQHAVDTAGYNRLKETAKQVIEAFSQTGL